MLFSWGHGDCSSHLAQGGGTAVLPTLPLPVTHITHLAGGLHLFWQPRTLTSILFIHSLKEYLLSVFLSQYFLSTLEELTAKKKKVPFCILTVLVIT